ncbi:hypothetical protein VCRA2113O415_10180 [Vibrio crassostreae]|nr:hypothetical protein VCRA2110O182_10213 [Vibrio crassostreae]CAK2299460.1 hypothetical protein VCRA2111O408_10659 [Vibrio crassostreae]CAK2302607.1 hypothetical protein VCRA211O406_10213 [Vibrio crassostreae]CAK2434189.1 hypothetical protein VCRA2113O415_10180 [Vibrio crassostreae]CAK2637012.1 hypothetical protein VCRA2113O420_10180 [Vibrio crassostreae]
MAGSITEKSVVERGKYGAILTGFHKYEKPQNLRAILRSVIQLQVSIFWNQSII